MTKEKLVNKILSILNEKIETYNHAIISAKESRDNETKRSVGDKYETNRAMMQMEVEKNRVQLNNTERLKHELSSLNFQKKYDKVEFGSLVVTDKGKYLISIAIGKIILEKEDIFCLSLASPIGKALHEKTIGDMVLFRGEEFSIIDIL